LKPEYKTEVTTHKGMTMIDTAQSSSDDAQAPAKEAYGPPTTPIGG